MYLPKQQLFGNVAISWRLERRIPIYIYERGERERKPSLASIFRPWRHRDIFRFSRIVKNRANLRHWADCVLNTHSHTWWGYSKTYMLHNPDGVAGDIRKFEKRVKKKGNWILLGNMFIFQAFFGRAELVCKTVSEKKWRLQFDRYSSGIFEFWFRLLGVRGCVFFSIIFGVFSNFRPPLGLKTCRIAHARAWFFRSAFRGFPPLRGTGLWHSGGVLRGSATIDNDHQWSLVFCWDQYFCLRRELSSTNWADSTNSKMAICKYFCIIFLWD